MRQHPHHIISRQLFHRARAHHGVRSRRRRAHPSLFAPRPSRSRELRVAFSFAHRRRPSTPVLSHFTSSPSSIIIRRRNQQPLSDVQRRRVFVVSFVVEPNPIRLAHRLRARPVRSRDLVQRVPVHHRVHVVIIPIPIPRSRVVRSRRPRRRRRRRRPARPLATIPPKTTPVARRAALDRARRRRAARRARRHRGRLLRASRAPHCRSRRASTSRGALPALVQIFSSSRATGPRRLEGPRRVG